MIVAPVEPTLVADVVVTSGAPVVRKLRMDPLIVELPATCVPLSAITRK